MESRLLGASGIEVSVVGLGCNNFGGRIDKKRSREVIDAALDAGITHFDTARTYGGGDSERFIGELLEGRRDRVVIATKFGGTTEESEIPIGTREHVRLSARESLERLRTDYLDVLYVHYPPKLTVSLEETWGYVQELVGEGVVRAGAVSNVTPEQLRALDGVAAVQNEHSLLKRDAEDDVLPACKELGVAFIPYFPLASGLLTGKYRRGEPPPEGTRLAGREIDADWDRIEALEAFAGERGHSLLELAIAGLAALPAVGSVITGATSAEQVNANAKAAEWRLSAEDLAQIP